MVATPPTEAPQLPGEAASADVSAPPAMRAAQKATNTIPIVFVLLSDPAVGGYVTSLARPGGNMTGLASQYEELITKQLQLLQ